MFKVKDCWEGGWIFAVTLLLPVQAFQVLLASRVFQHFNFNWLRVGISGVSRRSIRFFSTAIWMVVTIEKCRFREWSLATFQNSSLTFLHASKTLHYSIVFPGFVFFFVFSPQGAPILAADPEYW